MNEQLAILGAFVLLAAPGPTNVLLAASGGAAGFVPSVRLCAAVVLGYAASIAALTLIVGPFAYASPWFNLGLRVACALFLLYAAWRLWREAGMAQISAAPVKFRRVLVATALNPKAVVLAYVIMPQFARGEPARIALYAIALAGFAAAVGAVWIAAGAAARASASGAVRAGAARRLGAIALCAFAVLMLGAPFTS